MVQISNSELKKEIQTILESADLDNTSAKKVRLQLEEKLDCDLTDRKKEVDALVMEVIDEQTQDDDEEDEEEDNEDSEEEEEEKPRKKAPVRKRAASESASGSDSDDDGPPSDGGGSDYEPDEPVKIPKGRKKAAGKKKKNFGSDDESSGEEWGKKKSTGSKKKKSRAADSDDSDSDYEKPKKKKRKSGGKTGYLMPVKLSSDLADIVGAEELPRGEVVKKMWEYIKENKLQDPKNKSFVKCDEKLSKIIPTKKFRGFGMTKFPQGSHERVVTSTTSQVSSIKFVVFLTQGLGNIGTVLLKVNFNKNPISAHLNSQEGSIHENTISLSNVQDARGNSAKRQSPQNAQDKVLKMHRTKSSSCRGQIPQDTLSTKENPE